jgi:hypothetical protein
VNCSANCAKFAVQSVCTVQISHKFAAQNTSLQCKLCKVQSSHCFVAAAQTDCVPKKLRALSTATMPDPEVNFEGFTTGELGLASCLPGFIRVRRDWPLGASSGSGCTCNHPPEERRARVKSIIARVRGKLPAASMSMRYQPT